jgi:hypothetical protein
MAKMASLAEMLKAYSDDVVWVLFDGILWIYENDECVETIVWEVA